VVIIHDLGQFQACLAQREPGDFGNLIDSAESDPDNPALLQAPEELHIILTCDRVQITEVIDMLVGQSRLFSIPWGVSR